MRMTHQAGLTCCSGSITRSSALKRSFALTFRMTNRENTGASLKQSHALGLDRGDAKKPVLVLLVPESRLREADEGLEQQGLRDIGCVISWERLIEALHNTRTVDPAAVFLAQELRHFVRRRVHAHYDLLNQLTILRRDIRDVDDTPHTQFVGWVWRAFPCQGLSDAPTRLSRSRGWYVGYYFLKGPHPHHVGWFGFIPSEFIEGRNDRSSTFIIALHEHFLTPVFDDSRVPVVRVRPCASSGFDRMQCWQVELQEGLEDLQAWRRLLTPLHNTIDRLITETKSASG